MTRTAKINRKTAETDIQLTLDLDGAAASEIDTGVGFLDHMLELFARHGSFGLQVQAVVICMSTNTTRSKTWGSVWGWRCAKRWATREGFAATGTSRLPMEETLVTVAVDLSGGRSWCFKRPFPRPRSVTSTASWSRISGKRWHRMRCAICTSSCTTVATATTSPKRSSKPRLERCAWPSIRPAHARRAKHQRRAVSPGLP